MTGIKPSGTPHLGNYLGMIRPALSLQDEGFESFYFIASYHALTTMRDRERVRQTTTQIAATFLALGFQPEHGALYRQQDVPEVTELAWVFNCITAMGMLERSHAYKAALDNGLDPNAGLFTYPVLMAADILALEADVVPVGQDQKQHLEICRDITRRFNHHFGDVLKLPEMKVQEGAGTVVGLDGRKMAKSYDNTIGIFDPPKLMRKKIMSITTDSTPMEEPKDQDSCNVMALYRLVATPDQVEDLEARYRRGGIGYGHAKQELFEALDAHLAGPRERYHHLMAHPDEIRGVLEEGASKAREVARKVTDAVRDAVGL